MPPVPPKRPRRLTAAQVREILLESDNDSVNDSDESSSDPDSDGDNESGGGADDDSDIDGSSKHQNVGRESSVGRGRGRRGGRGRGILRAQGCRQGQVVANRYNTRPGAAARQDVWTDGTNFVPQIHAFHGKSGINVNTNGFEMVHYFKLFVDNDLINCLMTETNRYAAQWIQGHPEEMAKPRCRARDWRPVTSPEEMYHFLSLTLMMGIIKKPTIQLYWSKDPLYFTPLFPAVMERDRYQLLLRFLHFVNNEDAPNHQDKTRDRLFKIRPLIEDLNEKFQRCYTPSQDLALDESLLLWKGRLLFRQYLPAKRAKYGIKMYNLCENSGYTYRFRVYTGAQDPGSDINNILPNDTADLNQTEKLIVYMMLPLLGQGYSLYVDNYYTSVKVFRYLHSKSTNATGTTRANRVPNTVKNVNVEKGGNKTFKSGELLFTKFVDKKDVYLLTTEHEPGTTQVRIRGNKNIYVDKPNAVIAYNQKMGAVDRADQLLQPYSAPRKTLKWYRKLSIHLFQVAMLNAFILYRIDHGDGCSTSFLQFQKEVLA